MSISNQKGDIGEAHFVLRATEKGYWTGKMPQDCPYDFVLDRGKGLERVQVKYRSSAKKGSIQINSFNSSPQSNRTYNGFVDQFAVYNPETSEVYLIPANLVMESGASIFRVEYPKNNQLKGVTFLSEFKEW
jgi:hypothetical protein